jgi:hypothetical protein
VHQENVKKITKNELSEYIRDKTKKYREKNIFKVCAPNYSYAE